MEDAPVRPRSIHLFRKWITRRMHANSSIIDRSIKHRVIVGSQDKPGGIADVPGVSDATKGVVEVVLRRMHRGDRAHEFGV